MTLNINKIDKGKIANKEYREMFGITDRMALIDLSNLCMKKIFERIGKTGRKTEYILTRQTRNKPESKEMKTLDNATLEAM